MKSRIKKIIASNIEEISFVSLVIYLCFYYFLGLYQKALVYNYILVILIGIVIGCKLMKWGMKYLKR